MALAPIHPEGPDIASTLAPVQPEGLDVTAGGGGGSPGGSNQQIQFNNGGAFGGTVGFTWNSATQALQMATPFIDFRLQGDGGIFLVGGTATGSGYVVGSDDQLVWGNNATRLTVEPTGEVLINTDAGNPGDVFTTNGMGGSPSWQPPAASGITAPIETSGYQDVVFTLAKSGGDATGLSNDATVYSAIVQLDGGPGQNVDVTGSNAQTFTDLINEINADLVGGSIALIDGTFYLRLSSASTGSSSFVSIVDLGLFNSLTDFRGIRGGVQGESALGATVRWDGITWASTFVVKVVNDLNAIQIGPVNYYPTDASSGTELALYAGQGGSAGDTFGGGISLNAGAASGSANGGAVQIVGGYGSGAIYGESSLTDVSQGGQIIITSGVGWNAVSGSIVIQVPNPSAAITVDVPGNQLALVAGPATSNTGAGVDGGSLTLTPGQFAGTGGRSGSILAGINNEVDGTRAGNFLYIPVADAPPSGTPGDPAAGALVPLVYDVSTDRLYAFNGSWKFAQFV